jgi:hypothetical protein
MSGLGESLGLGEGVDTGMGGMGVMIGTGRGEVGGGMGIWTAAPAVASQTVTSSAAFIQPPG